MSGGRESCSLVKLQSERERCRLQIRQTDLQARYRPESEASAVYFLPAQCSDMSMLFSVFPVGGGQGSLYLRLKFQTSRILIFIMINLCFYFRSSDSSLFAFFWPRRTFSRCRERKRCSLMAGFEAEHCSSIWHVHQRGIKFVYQIWGRSRSPPQSRQENAVGHRQSSCNLSS